LAVKGKGALKTSRLKRSHSADPVTKTGERKPAGSVMMCQVNPSKPCFLVKADPFSGTALHSYRIEIPSRVLKTGQFFGRTHRDSSVWPFCTEGPGINFHADVLRASQVEARRGFKKRTAGNSCTDSRGLSWMKSHLAQKGASLSFRIPSLNAFIGMPRQISESELRPKSPMILSAKPSPQLQETRPSHNTVNPK